MTSVATENLSQIWIGKTLLDKKRKVHSFWQIFSFCNWDFFLQKEGRQTSLSIWIFLCLFSTLSKWIRGFILIQVNSHSRVRAELKLNSHSILGYFRLDIFIFIFIHRFIESFYFKLMKKLPTCVPFLILAFSLC